MKKIALIVILFALLMSPDAESGSVFWDISGDSRMGLEEVIYTLQSTAELRIDKKVGLPDALYVLKILAGSEGNAEETGMFKLYRADVLEQLQRTANAEFRYSSEFNEYTITLSDGLPDVCIGSHVPGVRLDISISQDKRYFKLTASHENIKGYVWSFDSKRIFAENDVIISDDIRTYGLDITEALKFYREGVIKELNIARLNEEAYLSEFDTYADTLSKIGFTSYYPFVHIEILTATKDYFKLKGTHDKAPEYIWTYDSVIGFMENGVIYTLPDDRTYGLDAAETFKIYRQDVIQQLGVVYKNEEAYRFEFETYADTLSKLGYKSYHPYIPVHIEILTATKDYFKLKGTHDKVPNYVWTYDSAAKGFTENGVIYVPEQGTTDQCKLYLQVNGTVKQFLGNIFQKEVAYYNQHHIYTDKLSDLGLSVPSTPDGITFEIQLGNNGQSYIAKGTHPILDCVWTINEKAELVKIPK